MSKLVSSDIEFELKKLFVSYADAFESHQWPLEELRWSELVFALLSQVNKTAVDANLRELVERMNSLDLLEVEKLAELGQNAVKPEDGQSDAVRARIKDIMLELGFDERQIADSILAMHEAAKSLKEHYGGKIQKYMRKYSQRMVDDIQQNFSFSKMDKNEVRYAFSFWLQNVMNAPISLFDENIKDFCDYFKIKPYELVEVADKLDINLALVDDLIEMRLAEAAALLESQEEKKG